MGADTSTLHPEMAQRGSRAVKSSRTQFLLFSTLNLILTAATVWAGRDWLRNSETLVSAARDQ